MALLIVDLHKLIGNEDTWRSQLAEALPDQEVRFWPEAGEPRDIEYLAFMRPDFDVLPAFPNLKAMFSRSAGVEAFAYQPKFPTAPLCKVELPEGDPMMTEYVLMHVLRLHREMPKYAQAQARREWLKAPIVRPEQRRIGFLGMGAMARTPATILQSLGFKVSAWTRSQRSDAGFPTFHGAAQLEPFLAQTDIAVCLLPLTPETTGILSARTFAMLPKGAMIVNLGRGGHVVDADLIAALDTGQLAHAALDVTQPEPLPSDSPLWDHPNVTIMPHVARRPTVAQIVTAIAANIRHMRTGAAPRQQIDVKRGY